MSVGCFSLVSGMFPAEQNGGDFIGYGTFVFIDNSENITTIISHFYCFRKGILQTRGTVELFFVSVRHDSLKFLLKYTI